MHILKRTLKCAQLQLSEILIVSISEKKDKQKFIKNDEKNGTKISKIVRKRERSKIYFSLATITIFLRHSCKTLRECFKFLKPLRNISKKGSKILYKWPYIKYVGRWAGVFLWRLWNILGIYWWVRKYFLDFLVGNKIFSYVLFS